MSEIYVVGHKNPDNDCVMAAVTYAAFKNVFDTENVYVPCIAGTLPAETAWVLSENGIAEPKLLEHIEEDQKVILVDHNEFSQAVDGMDSANIVEVIDHHRLGGLTTSTPITYMCLPVGSTCGIIADLYTAHRMEIPNTIATCLLSAMMTDTVMMKSPTTTKFDRTFAHILGEQLGLDPVEFGTAVFRSRGADTFTVEQMCAKDTKLFNIAGKKVYIGQYETVNKDGVLENLEDLSAAMENYRIENNGDVFVLAITDIIEEGSQILMTGETEIAASGLGIECVEGGTWMPGVLSRKKQIAAPIIAAGE